jgi:hypothetical protein
MSSLHFVAAKLPSDARKQIAIQSLARRTPISRLAVQEKVSRKFIYQQKHKTNATLNQAFSPVEDASDVLFYRPVTAAWLNQLVLSLVLICHSSYRGVIQLLAALFDTSISLETIHNLLADASNQAAQINGSQDFSAIQVGQLDEIFQ